MNPFKRLRYREMIASAVVGMLLASGGIALAGGPASSDDAAKRSTTDLATSAPTFVHHSALQGWTGVYWTPVGVVGTALSVSGTVTTAASTQYATDQSTATTATGATTVGSGTVTSRLQLTVQNRSTTIGMWCGGASTVTNANSIYIEPSTSWVFKTSHAIRCIADPTAAYSYEEVGP